VILAVLDTNVLVSAMISPGGPPGRILSAWRIGEFLQCTSPELIGELRDVIGRSKFQRHDRRVLERAELLIEAMLNVPNFVKPAYIPRVVPNDPDDDVVLATAVAGRVDGIVSGDQHLLALGRHQGIAIMTPLQFLAELPRRSH